MVERKRKLVLGYDMDLLQKAVDNLSDSRIEIQNQLRDGHGTIAWVLQADGEPLVLVAKEYAHGGNASFMKALVNKATDAGANLVFYSDQSESYTVFDATYYEQNGIKSVGDSQKGEDVDWLERPLDDGVSLSDYLGGVSKPTTIAGKNKQLTQW